MALANPIVLLVGGLLLTIPIVLHFLMQRKPKHHMFPALQFVRRRQSTNQKKLQLRHVLLLMLRCAAIAALAAAFAGLSSATNLAGAWLTIGGFGIVAVIAAVLFTATVLMTRPINKILAALFAIVALVMISATGWLASKAVREGKEVVITNEREPVAAVLLFDTGPQMQYRFDNQTRLEKARQIGQWVTGQLPLESRVSICDSQANEPVFSVDISAANKRMQALQHTFLPKPFGEQLRNCIALAESSDELQREVYVFTDMSIAAWRDANQSSLNRLLEQDQQTHLYVIDVSADEPTNFLLGELQVSTQSIGSQVAAEIQTELIRLGPAESRTVEVRVEERDKRLPVRRDDRTIVPESRVVNSADYELSANGQLSIELPITELESGLHHGSVRIVGDDGLSIDDERFFTIRVRDQWPVLVVAPQDVYSNDIVEILENNRAVSLQIKTIRQQNLADEKLEDYKAVVLLDPLPPDEAEWSTLLRFVEDGGSVAMFLGNNAAKGGEIDVSFNSEIALRMLPGRLSNVWRVDDNPVWLNPTEFNHPVLRPMQGYATSIPWTEFPIRRFWGFSAGNIENDESVESILQFSNGRPALIQRQVGDGRVLLMTTPVTEPFRPKDRRRWNDLMLGGECWPTWWLVRNISEYLLIDEKERLNYTVGETAVLDNDAQEFPDQYQMFPPMNEEPQRVIAQEGKLIYRFVDQPGVFRLKGRMTKKTSSGEDDQAESEAVNRGFSANLPPQASELTRITDEQLESILGKDRFQLASDQQEIKRKQGNARQGREFYPVFILMLAILFGLESVMANWFYKTT